MYFLICFVSWMGLETNLQLGGTTMIIEKVHQ